MKKALLSGIIGLLAIFSFSGTAFAQGTNGSFEEGTDPGTFTVVNEGGTMIDSWKVESGSVDYIGSYWQASAGKRSVDLNGNEKGAISLNVPTVDGATYHVTFYMSGNPDGGDSVKKLSVSADGRHAVNFSYDTDETDNTLANMKWEKKTYVFKADGNQTKLLFASQMDGAWGAAIDNVVIVRKSPEDKIVKKLKDFFKNKNQLKHERMAECKDFGWKDYDDKYSFRNQGDCVSYFATGHKNVPGKNIPRNKSN